MTRPIFDLSLSALLTLTRETLQSPRTTADKLIALQMPNSVVWLMLMIIATLSVLLGQVASLVLMPDAQSIDVVFLANPLMMAAVQYGVLVITVYAVFWIGGLLGGSGTMSGVLTLMCWLQFVMFCVQVVQTASLLVLPGLAEIVTLVGFFLFLWLFTVFVAAAHGFQNMFTVFGMIVASTFAIAVALTFILAVLGISFEVNTNV